MNTTLVPPGNQRRHGTLISIALIAGMSAWPVARAAESFAPKTKEECVMATARIRMTDLSGKVTFGSGFFLNEGDCTYLYTSARAIDGADKLEIFDYGGAPVTGIEWIEAFAEPTGLTAGPDAGDGVRMKLSKRREIALSLTTQWDELTAGRELLVYGSPGGTTRHETGILPAPLKENADGILLYDCKATAAAGGGAVVDAKTLKVVAMNIWMETALPEDSYKRMLGVGGGEGAAAGVVLRNAQWKRFATKDYLAQGKAVHQLRNNLELMILMTYMLPSARGLRPVPGDDFVAGMKVGDAIRKHDKDPLMLNLQSLNDRLSANAARKVKASSQDIYKEYLTTLDMILRKRTEVLSALQPNKLSYYHKNYLAKRQLTSGDMSYAVGISECRAWFKQKSSVGGNNPFGEWETFPPIGAKLAKAVEQKLIVE